MILMRIPRHIFFLCLLLFILLGETTCVGGYVLTKTLTDYSFFRKGLSSAYQECVRYQAASWGNWLHGGNYNRLASKEI
jgi:hypothetical protein